MSEPGASSGIGRGREEARAAAGQAHNDAELAVLFRSSLGLARSPNGLTVWAETASTVLAAACVQRVGGDLSRLGVTLKPLNGNPAGLSKAPGQEDFLDQVLRRLRHHDIAPEDALVLFGAAVRAYRGAWFERGMEVGDIALRQPSWRSAAIEAHPAFFRSLKTPIHALAQLGSDTDTLHPAETSQGVRKALEALRALGIDDRPNVLGRDPLFLACTGRQAIVRGAFVDHYGNEAFSRCRDRHGDAPLHHLAGQWWSSREVRELLDLGADPLSLDASGRTPLQRALTSDRDNIYVIEALLRTESYDEAALREIRQHVAHPDIAGMIQALLAKIQVSRVSEMRIAISPL